MIDNVSMRTAAADDEAFALYVTEVCMRSYAEQTWGTWDGRADFDLGLDNVVQLAGQDIGLMGVDRRSDSWFLEKLYLLPAYQNLGIGSLLIERLIDDAKSAQVALRMTVLEVFQASSAR